MTGIERLGVIGDVHAEDWRLQVALDFLGRQDLDAIVCTGDIVDGSGCPNRSVNLLRAHDVLTVRGNHDRWLLQDRVRNAPDAHSLNELDPDTVDYLSGLPLTLELETVAGTLLLCHGIGDNDLQKIWPGSKRLPAERSEHLDEIIAGERYRFLINGHMHFRTIIHFEALTLINAGTLKNTHRPGFSIIDFAASAVSAFEFDEKQVVLSKRTDLAAVNGHRIWKNTADFQPGWIPELLYGDLDLQE